MMSEVIVRHMSEEELLKARIGAKCDLENRPVAKRGKDSWKWRSEAATAASSRKEGLA